MGDAEITTMKEDIATIKNDLSWIKNMLLTQSTDTENKAKLLALETERVRESFQAQYATLEDEFGRYKETQTILFDKYKESQTTLYTNLKERFDKNDFLLKVMTAAASTSILYVIGRIMGLVTIGADHI